VVLPVEVDGNWTALVVIRDGVCYRVDLETDEIIPTFELKQSRNPLHQSICMDANGWLYQGEYGSNPHRSPVPVHRSTDEGRTWQTIFEFPAGRTRHVHGCFWDPYEERVWICTGDFDGENQMLVADEDFGEIEWLGDGSQKWRTCHPIFTEQAVYWGMDSQLETSYICRLDRHTRTVEKIRPLPGPVWYAKTLDDGWWLIATVVEKGPGVHSNHARIFASRNLEDWVEIFRAKKDAWKTPHFKNGVIAFADGNQSCDAFYFFCEALVGLDGRSYRARLVER
jgi:hypothetical protein